MPVRWETIEPLLLQASKPARYVGGELNQVIKPEMAVRCCLAFPDLYEIGMSYHGFRILYERINAREGWAAERTYAPWPDFEKLMRAHGVPLYSLETRRALTEFDWIGFTLQHETNYTNILNMIDLAGLPIESRERTAPFPILIGGGEGAYSPEPLAAFLDAFVVGDGEEISLELMTLFERARAEGWSRDQILRALARTEGVYVPSFYEIKEGADGHGPYVKPIEMGNGELAPTVIRRRHFDIARDMGPTRPLVPLMRTVHDRLVIEIRRGCVGGCRFCQAGMINRPISERPLDQVVEIAREGLRATGYDGLSLLSLSSADYTMITPLVRELGDAFGGEGVSVNLPSLRINSFDIALVDEIARVRKSGFTFAPEAGTARLRQVINKPVDQDYFFELIEDVLRRGWQTIKFYFMIGLPTETDTDLDGIVEICEQAGRLAWKYHRKRATINVTLSPFVPKANTPFQWEAQVPREELERRYQYVRGAVAERAGRGVDVKMADTTAALIEAVLARGDRRVGRALRRAWELGAKFDGWDEFDTNDLWLRAFEETGVDPAWYASRERGAEESLPFEHIESTVGRRFLAAEARRARRELATAKCDTGPCAGCEACEGDLEHKLAKDLPGGADDAAAADAPANVAPEHGRDNRSRGRKPERADSPAPVQRLRLTYSRLSPLRYLSHLDFIKIIHSMLRRAAIPLAFTQGFNPQPRVQFAPPLSLGVGGEREMLEMMLIGRITPAWLLKAMKPYEIEGLQFLEAEEIPIHEKSLEARILASDFRVEFTLDSAVTPETLSESICHFASQESLWVKLHKKNGTREVDLKRSLRSLESVTPEDPEISPAALRISIFHEEGLFVKPHEAAGFLLGREIELGRDARVTREQYRFENRI